MYRLQLERLQAEEGQLRLAQRQLVRKSVAWVVCSPTNPDQGSDLGPSTLGPATDKKALGVCASQRLPNQYEHPAPGLFVHALALASRGAPAKEQG